MNRARPSEAGESLIETVVAVTILGIAVVALLGGLTTAVLTSGTHRKQADVGTVLTAASEQVKSTRYVACAVSTDYLPSSVVYPGWTGPAPAFSIADWNGTSFVPRGAGNACGQYDGLGYREQLVTITVTTADARVSQTNTILKRYRDCPNPAVPTDGCD